MKAKQTIKAARNQMVAMVMESPASLLLVAVIAPLSFQLMLPPSIDVMYHSYQVVVVSVSVAV